MAVSGRLVVSYCVNICSFQVCMLDLVGLVFRAIESRETRDLLRCCLNFEAADAKPLEVFPRYSRVRVEMRVVRHCRSTI